MQGKEEGMPRQMMHPLTVDTWRETLMGAQRWLITQFNAIQFQEFDSNKISNFFKKNKNK